MFCRKCGEENPDNAVFCRNCGERLKEEEVKKAEVICIVAVFIVFAILGAIFRF